MIRIASFAVSFLVAASAFAGTPDAEIVVPLRDIPRGAVIAETELAYESVPAHRASATVATAIADLAGMEARRNLRAGEPVRFTDVKRPVLVAKGATVTMIFEAPGVKLSATGRAMAEGGMGQSITVLNPVSHRQIEAVVTGPGTVRAGAAPGRLVRAGD